MYNPTVAPAPMFPEKSPTLFERGMGYEVGRLQGPQRFMEGVSTDTDVPFDFGVGAYGDTSPAPTRVNHANPTALYKPAAQTMRERAHVGSASWIEAPSVLSEFVQGAVAGDGMPAFEYSYNSGAHMNRPNPTRVYD